MLASPNPWVKIQGTNLVWNLTIVPGLVRPMASQLQPDKVPLTWPELEGLENFPSILRANL